MSNFDGEEVEEEGSSLHLHNKNGFPLLLLGALMLAKERAGVEIKGP